MPRFIVRREAFVEIFSEVEADDYTHALQQAEDAPIHDVRILRETGRVKTVDPVV